MTTITFKLSGLHCTSCALTIDLDLEEVPGVKNATTSYAASQTMVEYDPALVSPETLKQVIAKSGYQVVG